MFFRDEVIPLLLKIGDYLVSVVATFTHFTEIKIRMSRRKDDDTSGWKLLVGALVGAAIGAAIGTAIGHAVSLSQDENEKAKHRLESPKANKRAPSSPSEVLFTQKSITNRVNHQGRQDPLLTLVKAVFNKKYVNPIRIVYHAGCWRSIDNHRLFAFQLYELAGGKLSLQWFQVIPDDEEFRNKNQTSDGRSINVAQDFLFCFGDSTSDDVSYYIKRLQSLI